jgi:hypothetical protein
MVDMSHKAGQTVAQRARQRARESRLRAVYHEPPNGAPYYVVYNLSGHRKYLVWHAFGAWQCNCEAGKAKQFCKHIARVRDREERRIKQEALRDS